jgi:hypothetical protein
MYELLEHVTHAHRKNIPRVPKVDRRFKENKVVDNPTR